MTDWKDVLIAQAISTVLLIARSGEGKGKFRPAMLKILRTLADQFRNDEEGFAIMRDVVTNKVTKG